MLTFIALMTPLGGNVSLYADEIYKSVDAQGHVVYSDRGTSKTSQKSVVQVDQPDPAEAARAAKEQQLLKAEEIQRQKQQSADEGNKAVQDQQKRNQKIQCENARSRYFSLKDAGRLYKTDPDGNRVYYSDTEADSRREEAHRVMNAACAT